MGASQSQPAPSAAQCASAPARSQPYKNDHSKYWVNTSAAALFIPRGPHNVLRDSFRRVVFRTDCRSATAISALIMKDLPEAEIYNFINDFRKAETEFRGAEPEDAELNNGILDGRKVWSSRQNEHFSKLPPGFAKVDALVQKYRLILGDLLYQLKLVDVRIRDVHTTEATYKADLDRLRAKVC